jgi:D-mannonate dehydratase
LTATDFEALEDALDTLSKDKKILVEMELDDLKEEMAEYQEVSECMLADNLLHFMSCIVPSVLCSFKNGDLLFYNIIFLP